MYVLVFQVITFLQIFRPELCMNFHTSHACYMLRPFHLPRSDHLNIIWGRAQIMKFFVTQFFKLQFFKIIIAGLY
jgi:hypothetical protein